MPEDMEMHTSDAQVSETAVAEPVPAAALTMMVRDPEKVPGMGMCKALVPAGEVEHYKAAGWTVAEE